MIKISTSAIGILLMSSFAFSKVDAHSTWSGYKTETTFYKQQDTSKKSKGIDTIGQMVKALAKFGRLRDTLHIKQIINVPNFSLQQVVKGNLAGVYVQERSGEAGSEQGMVIQGPSGLVFNKKDVYAIQPTVYINGVPLTGDHPFAFDIQKYDYNRIGPATNLLSQIDMDNVESIKVIKDPVELARLGPNAANGAIYVTTKNARSGSREISLNSYVGFAGSPQAYTINGAYLNNFRKPFYQQYAKPVDYARYASYLRDSTNLDYFGPSNWTDLYYSDPAIYTANLGITGGSERANFRFYGGATKNAGSEDHTRINRYNMAIGVNMAPFKWLTLITNINAARLDRKRNTTLRDKLAETRYFVDLSSPLSPNAANYAGYLSEYEKSVDLNRTLTLNGNVTLAAKLKRFSISSNLIFDYNEGIRDLFLPSTLLAGSNYVSNYFGYSQRLLVQNAAAYHFDLAKEQSLTVEVGQSLQGDTYKYNYAQAYNGPNDFIKINVVNGNSAAGNYLNAFGNFYINRFLDKERSNLFSVWTSAAYSYKNILSLNAVLRRDGSSTGQPDSRWETTPAFSASWNIKNHLLADNSTFNSFRISASWGRMVRQFLDDRFAAGPQYRTEGAWKDEPSMANYGTVIGVMRPYTSGFVGYNIPLAIAERSSATLETSFLKDRLNVAVTVYNRNDKNAVINIPVAIESGYSSEFKSGLDLNNRGVELLLTAEALKANKGLNWLSSLNLAVNQNKVKALPGGLKELVYNENKLEVGKSSGAYWLFDNKGIYNSSAEVPVNPATGQKMTFNGFELKAGDPKWVDYNNDYNIDQNDKILMGSRLPKLTGGWANTFSYRNFELNFNLIFAVGQKALNQYDAVRYDFINSESANEIVSAKEISSWQTFSREKSYPLYNPWSDVVPYREDQNLFLEDASYLKLRSVTLGYNFSKIFKKMKTLRRAYLYATAMNLFTVTKFSGVDPELVNYNGIYDGANLSIPKTFVLGFKLGL